MDKLEQIKEVLRRYYWLNDEGVPNQKYNPSMTSTEAIDKIREIVGPI